MTISYAVMAAVAVLLLVLYATLVQNKENWLFLLYGCVAAVNLGYLLLSASSTLEFALLANKLSYLGSVFLPLCMLMTILKLCGFRPGKRLITALVCISGLMFAMICTTGHLPWYYREVSLVFVDGSAKLEKIYGVLHPTYLIYLLGFFLAMIVTIIYSWKTGRTVAWKHAALMAAIVLSNMAVWFLEKFIPGDFEFLSVSYLFSEVVLLGLYWMMQDYVRLDQVPASTAEPEPKPAAEEPVAEELPVERVLRLSNLQESLTPREREILELMVRGKKRKEIAEDLCLSENTIKTHTRTLYSKLGIGSREELYALLEQ
jgi:DNA-binding CsgD family transcriptional regulator